MVKQDGVDGPDLSEGVSLSKLEEGEPFAGHVEEEPVVVVKRGEKILAIGARCTHYGGPLAEGLVVGETIRCPWHHAVFDLNSGEAVGAPALSASGCYPVEIDGESFRVLPKKKGSSSKAPADEPESVLIVGAGAAAMAAAKMLRQEGYGGPVTMIGAEEPAPVDRPKLSKGYLAGNVSADAVPVGQDEHWEALDVEVVTGEQVAGIDRQNKSVQTDSGDSFDYDVLLYATGAEPVVPPVQGLETTTYFTLRSFRDSQTIIEAAEDARKVLVLGASFIGLEVAASLRNRDVEIDVVAPESLPLQKTLGDEVGRLIRGIHEEEGVRFHLGCQVERFEGRKAVLSDGDEVVFDFVVLGTGVRPRTELAERAGLEVDEGVIVDDELRTSDDSIYAAGDVARFPDPIGGGRTRVEHWVLAERLGQRAARQILGVKNPNVPKVPFFWTTQLGLTINYVGNAQEYDEVIVDGSVADQDAAVGYVKDGRVVAVLTIHRNMVSLRAEEALHRGDQHGLRELLGQRPDRPSTPRRSS